MPVRTVLVQTRQYTTWPFAARNGSYNWGDILHHKCFLLLPSRPSQLSLTYLFSDKRLITRIPVIHC
jgi:hypothetical protein